MERQVSYKEKFIWNMLGSLSNAFSTLILTISVNRILGGESGGIFAFAYSNAQLMLTIGNFEVRPLQSTDVEEKYKFDVYYWFKIITCIIMMAITSVYILISGFGVEKSVIVLFLALFKMAEAFTDLYGGRFQQLDRIDLTGKLFFVRVVISTIGFIVSMIVTKSLVVSSVCIFICSFGLYFVYDKRFIFIQDRHIEKVKFIELFDLCKETLPLFIGSFVMMYLSNAPKYAINDICGDDVQNIYNILFMPAFVINLFSLFVFRPMLVDMTKNWLEGNLCKLFKVACKVYGMIFAATVVVLIGTWILGIPVLSLLYGVDLYSHKIDLMMVMIVGGISAVMTFSYYLITVMRQQNLLLVGYGVSFIYSFFVSEIFVRRLGIKGAIIAYGSSVTLLVLVYAGIILIAYRRRRSRLL